MTTIESLREALNAVEDPEIGMGIVDLGLVYDVALDGDAVKITYTLTSMGCPVGPWIAEQIEQVANGCEGIEKVETELVWSPAWSPELMSEDAKFILGY
jgi:metal-sulfur cluster biosynthetic enzyme